jgi:DNA mismatch repair protein MSH4
VLNIKSRLWLRALTTHTDQHEMQAETRYDNSRRYWLRICEANLSGRPLPDIFINQFRKKGYIECQTLDLMKLNQRIEDSHQEVVLMSDNTIQDLVDNVRGEIPHLFRVCESIAMVDMISAFRCVLNQLFYSLPRSSNSDSNMYQSTGNHGRLY